MIINLLCPRLLIVTRDLIVTFVMTFLSKPCRPWFAAISATRQAGQSIPERLVSTAVMAVLLTIGLLPLSQPGLAQMQLPGALTPEPGAGAGPPGDPAKPKPKKAKPAPPRVITVEAVLGRPLMQNGRNGLLEFRRDGKDFKISRLKIAGEQISRNGEVCEVDIGDAPVLSPAGKPNGLLRYDVKVAACPFSVEIFDGAVLASHENKNCEFKAADCRVDPTGLWGQPAAEIGPQRSKEIEQQRHQSELRMRANFRAWLATVGKDKDMVKRIAREQAGFSSKREELCRSYARESQHGYCALVTTEGRSIALAVHSAPPELPPEEVTDKKKAKR